MVASAERRKEQRIRFLWPVWFGYDAPGDFAKGQAFDLSAEAVSFIVSNDCCPPVGHHILARFSYPMEHSDSFEMGGYYGWGEVVRLDDAAGDRKRVALRLHNALPDMVGNVEPAMQSTS